MKICTPTYVETDILNITPQFKEFCKSNHIKIMAAIQNASEKEYKKAIEVHPDLVNLDRPERKRASAETFTDGRERPSDRYQK
jgi:glycerophosphoryl diester phosphodiesterase